MKMTLNYPKSAAKGSFSQGLKHEFETAMVNEPSVFEPLKFYCNNNNKINMLFLMSAGRLTLTRRLYNFLANQFISLIMNNWAQIFPQNISSDINEVTGFCFTEMFTEVTAD